MEFKHARLDNGLTLIAEVCPEAASMALGFFARTGSRDESDRVHGVSHFLEHMMFKGTARRSAFDVNREFDELGAAYNAFTSEENTVYYAAVLSEFQTRAADLLADILRPALRQDDFDTEKQVILEEIALYEDRPEFRLYESLMQEHFAAHPLGRSVLGTPRSITELTREAMLDYFQRRYSPNNIVVAATGRLDWPALEEKIRSSCGDWVPSDAPRELPPGPTQRRCRSIPDERLVRQQIGLMSPAPSAQSEDRYAAQLLACILGDDSGSRLYYALIEPAIAEHASVTYDPMDGAGGMMTFVTSDPARAGEALRVAREELGRFSRTGPTAEELSAAKNKIASASVLKSEVPLGRLTSVGFEWVYRRGYEPLERQLEELLSVTADEVLSVARTYGLLEATLVSLGPVEVA